MLMLTFHDLLKRHGADQSTIDLYWQEVARHYSAKCRHYHTLAHLEHLLAQLTEVKDQIAQWDATLFSLYYHDAIYDALKKDNEERSADLAALRMEKLGLSKEIIAVTHAQIIATKAHQYSDLHDTNLFTDADLSILGADWLTYQTYAKQVRAEYRIYPDFLYNPGRRKVLRHFLDMPRIFKTEVFSARFEAQARVNLQSELEVL